MVIQTLWQNLKRLMAIDLQIAATKQEVSHSENLIKIDQAQLPKLQDQLEAKRHAHIQAQKDVDVEELYAQDLKDREAKNRSDLDKVKNQKEYEAASRELEKTIEERADLEETIMTVWHELDLAQKDLENFTKTAGEKRKQIEERIQTHQATLASFHTRLEELGKQRREIAQHVPAEWLEKYERMRTQVPDPIVPIATSSCSSCFYPILPQDLARILKNATLPCRNCYRLLYNDTQEESSITGS